MIQSLVYAWGVALRVCRLNQFAFIPYHVRLIMSIPSIFWWMLLLLFYPFEAGVASITFYGTKYYIANCLSGT